MRRLLRRYWIWYNDLPEPNRFGMAMLMMTPIFCIGIVTHVVPWPWTPVAAFTLVSIPCLLIFSRWWA